MASLSATGVVVIGPAPVTELTPTIVSAPVPLFPGARAGVVQVIFPALVANFAGDRHWTGIPPFPRPSPHVSVVFSVPIFQFDLTKTYTPLKGGNRSTPGHVVIYPDPTTTPKTGTVPPTDGWSGITI